METNKKVIMAISMIVVFALIVCAITFIKGNNTTEENEDGDLLKKNLKEKQQDKTNEEKNTNQKTQINLSNEESSPTDINNKKQESDTGPHKHLTDKEEIISDKKDRKGQTDNENTGDNAKNKKESNIETDKQTSPPIKNNSKTNTSQSDVFDKIIHKKLSCDFEMNKNGNAFLIFPVGNTTLNEFEILKGLSNDKNISNKWIASVFKGTKTLYNDYFKAIKDNKPHVHSTIMIPSSDNLFISLFYSQPNIFNKAINPFDLFQLVYNSFRVFLQSKLSKADSYSRFTSTTETYHSLERNLREINMSKEKLDEFIKNTPRIDDYDNLTIYKEFLELFFSKYTGEDLIKDKIDNKQYYDSYSNYLKEVGSFGNKVLVEQKENIKTEFSIFDYLIFINRHSKHSR